MVAGKDRLLPNYDNDIDYHLYICLYTGLFEQMFICAVNRATIFNIHIL